MRKVSMRIIAFMMAVIVAVASGGVATMAETVSDNGIAGDAGWENGNEEDDGKASETEDEDAEDKEESEPGLENEISLEGEDSFGELLSEAVQTEVAAQEENAGYHIFSVEMNGNKGTVSFETLEDAAVVVGIYDETGKKLLFSGYKKVSKEEAEIIVDVNADTMPAYFYLKAFLLNPNTLRPLCSAYESPNYTREMQEFFKKTTADFDADRVLNLDSDAGNNFAVYAKDAVVLEAGTTGTVLDVSNEEEQIYTFENADEEIKNLQAGDIFVYEYGDGTVLIIKVGAVRVEGNTVTLKGAETSLEEVFEYVKIDESRDAGDAEIDTSSCGEGVTYVGKGTGELQEEGVLNPEAAIGGDMEITHDFKIEKGSKDNKISGSVELSLTVSLKAYITRNYQYLELKMDYEAGVSGSIAGKLRHAVPLMRFGFSLGLGVYVECVPSLVLEASGKIELSGKLSGSIGVRVSNKEGAKSISKAPTFTMKLKAEATVYVGFSLEPKIKIIHEAVAKTSIKAEAGVEIKGTLEKTSQSDAKRKHDCKNCIDGDIFGKYEISFEIQFLNMDGLKWTGKFDDKKKVKDFYYSFDFNEFGFTTCPHLRYQMEFVVVDSAGKAIEDAAVKIGEESYKTDEKGVASVYLTVGNYVVQVEKKGYFAPYRWIRVDEGGGKVKVVMSPQGSGGAGSGDLGSGGNVKSVSLGVCHAGAVTNDGNLYMWGSDGNNGAIGNGTYDEIYCVPIKVMENVKLVSLGHWNTGAVTNDGSLYMWGNNDCGELGNDKGEWDSSYSDVPIKIMENVESISLGESTSAAVTSDGSLYMWGNNSYGELGNGTKTDSTVPIKIMENVKSVSLSSGRSAAITKDGSLYVWGDNTYGLLGDGTYVDSNIPIKIMENVESISLSKSTSAAVTSDGSLYMWGANSYGQLGNGTKTKSTVPIKIMENVENVSLGVYCSAAITKDGSLFVWGNTFLLGDMNPEDTRKPVKIRSGVKLVDLSRQASSNIAIVDNDGSLYMGGWNGNGELGNGVMMNDFSYPIKINLSTTFSTESVILAENANAPDNTFPGTGSFTNLLPNETYNFYVMKSKTAEEPLSADNLLYIGQGVSDAAGNLNIPYEARENYDGAVSFAVGMTSPDISSATVSIPNLKYNGKEQYAVPTVTYKGVTLTEGIDYILTGNFSAKTAGKYQLTVMGIGMFTGSKTASYSITEETITPSAKKKVTSLQLDCTSTEMTVGSSKRLTASIQPSDAADKTVRWSSDNPSVVTVDSNGEMRALKPGWAVISATTNDGTNLTAKCTVSVQPDVNDIPDGPSTWQGKTGTEGFVYRLYNVAMGREADDWGFNDWNSQLKNKEKTAAEVAQGFIFSEEFKNFNYNNVQYVKILYRTMFGREADEGGLNGWVSDLENGMSREYVYRGFAESTEFTNLCGNYGVERGSVTLSSYRDQNVGATGFIARLYTKMLGRGYDEDGLEYWCRLYLTGERTIENVASDGFLHSEELKNQNLSDEEFVRRMYQTFLNREPDEAGLKDWLGRLSRGEETRDSLVYGFTNSREFGELKKKYNLP